MPPLTRPGLLLGALLVLLSATAASTGDPTAAAPSPAVSAGRPGVPVVARASWASVGEAPAGTAYQWPLPGPPPLTRAFDPPARPWLPGHRGVDLAARAGAEVHAVGGGVVAFAGPVAGRPVVSIDHPGGLRTTYLPVAATVAAGDRVAPGDPIGVLQPGHPDCPAPACLHWGLRRGGTYLDPLSLLGLGRVRLLPHPGREPTGR